ncbi:MAG: hypothetical protein M3299_13455 [Thermoproteota archaeon]|nr:hypothetical protein [Thermoproteota archaeon]
MKVSTFSTEEQPERISLIRIGRGSEKSFALPGGFHPLKGQSLPLQQWYIEVLLFSFATRWKYYHHHMGIESRIISNISVIHFLNVFLTGPGGFEPST